MTDSTDDTVLDGLLLRISAGLERIAGRKLRREHAKRELFYGSQERLRLSTYPVVKVHHVRISITGNFIDDDEYEELVEGEDWTLDATAGLGLAQGDNGWIKARGRKFPAGYYIEVCYTGGYKTASEASLENGSLTIDGTTNTSLMKSGSVAKRYNSDGSEDGYLSQYADSAATVMRAGVEYASSVNKINRSFLTFSPGNVLLPTWQIVQATLTVLTNLADGSGSASVNVRLLPHDAVSMLSDPESLYATIDDPEGLLDGETGIISTHTRSSTTLTSEAIAIHSDASYKNAENMAILNRTLRDTGKISFSFQRTVETLSTNLAIGIATEKHGTTGSRPSLVLKHRDPIGDDQSVPDDIKNALFTQAAHEWNTRFGPGYRAETQRGASVASGVMYTKDPADYLPIVRQIMETYARVI